MSKIYEKWREPNFDFSKLDFKIEKIISYPPAGNDVFEILYQNKNVFFKVERSKMADFESEYTNINKVKKYYQKIPKIIKYGNIDDKKYLILSKIDGDRISDLITEKKINIHEAYKIYGAELAKIHKIPVEEFDISKKRLINNIISFDMYKNKDDFINNIYNFLINKIPNMNNDTFIHGDFHYANVLWLDKKINGVVDFEYSGKGYKEQDIAWTLIPRPSQSYDIDKNIINVFLESYKKINDYDYESFVWCFINGCAHFYLMNMDNSKYKLKLKEIMESLI